MRCKVAIERYVKNAFVVLWLERDYFTNPEFGILGGEVCIRNLGQSIVDLQDYVFAWIAYG